MFHVEVIVEDVRITARENGERMEVEFRDEHSGTSHTQQMDLEDVGKLVALALSPDGEIVPEITHEYVDSLLVGCPVQCRPIP